MEKNIRTDHLHFLRSIRVATHILYGVFIPFFQLSLPEYKKSLPTTVKCENPLSPVQFTIHLIRFSALQFAPMTTTKFSVTVRQLGGYSSVFQNLSSQTKAGHVKALIYEQQEIPIEHQGLMFAGVELVDTQTLAFHGIDKDCTIYLVLRLSTRPNLRLFHERCSAHAPSPQSPILLPGAELHVFKMWSYRPSHLSPEPLPVLPVDTMIFWTFNNQNYDDFSVDDSNFHRQIALVDMNCAFPELVAVKIASTNNNPYRLSLFGRVTVSIQPERLLSTGREYKLMINDDPWTMMVRAHNQTLSVLLSKDAVQNYILPEPIVCLCLAYCQPAGNGFFDRIAFVKCSIVNPLRVVRNENVCTSSCASRFIPFCFSQWKFDDRFIWDFKCSTNLSSYENAVSQM